MKTLGNVLWAIFGGFINLLAHYLVGIMLCITLVFIPFGIQHFKIGRASFLPFKKSVFVNFDAYPKANRLWIMFGGAGLALGHFLFGCVLCATVILIPFGIQHFKLMRLSLMPFGVGVE